MTREIKGRARERTQIVSAKIDVEKARVLKTRALVEAGSVNAFLSGIIDRELAGPSLSPEEAKLDRILQSLSDLSDACSTIAKRVDGLERRIDARGAVRADAPASVDPLALDALAERVEARLDLSEENLCARIEICSEEQRVLSEALRVVSRAVSETRGPSLADIADIVSSAVEERGAEIAASVSETVVDAIAEALPPDVSEPLRDLAEVCSAICSDEAGVAEALASCSGRIASVEEFIRASLSAPPEPKDEDNRPAALSTLSAISKRFGAGATAARTPPAPPPSGFGRPPPSAEDD